MAEANNNEQILAQIKQARAKRNSIFALILMSGATILLIIFGALEITPQRNTFIIATLSGFIVAVSGIYFYLQGRPISIPRSYTRRPPLQELRAVRTSLDETENLLSLLARELPTPERVLIIDRIKKFFDDAAYEWYTPDNFLEIEDSLFNTATGIAIISNSLSTTRTHILELIGQEQTDAAQSQRENERKLEQTMILGERAHTRLTQEIIQLSKRANIYIAIGTAITIIAGYFLYVAAQDSYQTINSITSSDNPQITQPKIIAAIVVKVSIVIFIEFFAFYFLKMHKSIMENIKYYQNEITNIDLKIAGLNAAEDSEERMKIAVEELLKTERNLLIKDKHTTIELEKIKRDQTSNSELISLISKIFSQK